MDVMRRTLHRFLPKVLEIMLLKQGERSDKLILMVIHKITDGLQNNWLKTFKHVKVMKDEARLRNCYRWKEHDKDIL